MNIAGQLEEIGIVLTENGFVSVLKKVTVSLMPAVIVDHISCQQFPHADGEWLGPCSEQEMKVIAHKGPRIDAQSTYATKIGKPLKKILPILSVAKYRYSINAPAYHMM